MQYLDETDLPIIFGVIQRHHSNDEDRPNYQDEPDGIANVLGAFERIKEDRYYPTLLEKVSALMLQINGHYFFNGNKRLAMVSSIILLGINNIDFREDLDKEYYCSLFEKIFPQFVASVEDYPEFSPEEFGLYNLSVLIADKQKYGITYENLKNLIPVFLEDITEEITV